MVMRRGPDNKAGKAGAGGRVSVGIRQTRPFDRPEREVAVTLLRTGDVMRHAVESALRPWGVSPEQYNVLRILRGAGDGLPTLEIAERMVARSPNITRLIDKMAAKGLAERHAVERDRRVVRISVTERGRSLLADLDQAVEAMLAKLGALQPARLRSLVKLLDAVRERLAVPTAREGLGAGRPKGEGR
jgi:DNA-binding MarR family transcriptional regulator